MSKLNLKDNIWIEGFTREELFAKIGTNVLGITALQGAQNLKEDAIKACTTVAELEAIVL